MRSFIIGLLIAISLLAGFSSPGYSGDFFFEKGDKVLFLGDSITEQYQYSSYIELYLTTRFPTWGLTFLNAGIGGDRAVGGAGRFANHVLAEKPTCITINFGMNDAGYGDFKPELQKVFLDSTQKMIEMAKEAKIRVALMSPNAVDRRVQNRFNLYLETQKQFYEPLAGIALKNGISFVDQYAVTRAAFERMEADKADKVLPFGDGFHTSPPGGLLMAHAILVGLKAPALVSSAEFNTDGGHKGTQCEISNVRRTANGVAFDRIDQAIPFPVVDAWTSVLPYVNELRDLNWYGLKVEGLPEAKYIVQCGKDDLATYTNAELAAGVNLALLRKGPIYEQGLHVHDFIDAKNKLVHSRFRDVVMFNPPGWLAEQVKELKPSELTKRMAKIVEVEAQITELAKPVSYRWIVRPAN